MTEDYVPEIVDKKYVKFLCVVTSCKTCDQKMLNITRKSFRRIQGLHHGLFPNYHKMTLEAQMRRANIEFRSELKDLSDFGYICEKCAEAGKATFKCVLCKKVRTSDLKQESFGYYPSEYLCKVCYETKTAKEWEEISDKLYKSHRYDWE